MKKLMQLGKSLSRQEQKAITGGVRQCAIGTPTWCFIYGNPNPEYPDAQLHCNSCDDWSGMAGDQCRIVCGEPIAGIPILQP